MSRTPAFMEVRILKRDTGPSVRPAYTEWDHGAPLPPGGITRVVFPSNQDRSWHLLDGKNPANFQGSPGLKYGCCGRTITELTLNPSDGFNVVGGVFHVVDHLDCVPVIVSQPRTPGAPPVSSLCSDCFTAAINNRSKRYQYCKYRHNKSCYLHDSSPSVGTAGSCCGCDCDKHESTEGEPHPRAKEVE